MAYQPYFTISPALLSLVEKIAALRERILGSPVGLSWIPALQKDTRTRNGHASTAIEGNPLTLEEVRALEEGRQVTASPSRFQREVTNYFAGLRHVEKHAGLKNVRHKHVFELHRLLAADATGPRARAVSRGLTVPPALAHSVHLLLKPSGRRKHWQSDVCVTFKPSPQTSADGVKTHSSLSIPCTSAARRRFGAKRP